jgi:hypothetical protein
MLIKESEMTRPVDRTAVAIEILPHQQIKYPNRLPREKDSEDYRQFSATLELDRPEVMNFFETNMSRFHKIETPSGVVFL